MTAQSLVDIIARHLVDHPSQVVVSKIEGQQTTMLELRVAQEDVGQIIGRQGRTVQAIRTILAACSGKLEKRIILQVIEKDNAAPDRPKSNSVFSAVLN